MRRGSKRLLLFAVWLSFVFILLQTAGYFLFNFTSFRPTEHFGYPDGLFAEHQALGFSYTPGFQGHFAGGLYRDIPLDINPTGFRDQAFLPIDQSQYRLAVVGDSVVFGAGVAAEDRFTDLLQREFATQNGKTRVLNLGVNSYTFGHYLTLAELDFLDIQPDAVLVGFTLNDIANMEESGGGRRERAAEEAGRLGPLAAVRSRLSQSYASRFLRELRQRWRTAMMSDAERAAYTTSWMKSVVAFWQRPQEQQRLRQELKSFAARLRAKHIPWGIAVFPELNDLLDPEQYSYPRLTALELFGQLGIPVCDLYPAFAAQGDIGALFLPRDSVHFSPAGHRLAAQTIAECRLNGRLGPPLPPN